MRDDKSVAGPSPDVEIPLDRDSPCRRCAYNLRGLQPGGVCPECALPIRVSIASDLLSHQDPDWLRGITRGVWLLFSATAIGLVVSSLRRANGGALSLDWLFGVAFGVMWLIAGVRILRPNPRDFPTWRSQLVRMIGLSGAGLIIIRGLTILIWQLLSTPTEFTTLFGWLYVFLGTGSLTGRLVILTAVSGLLRKCATPTLARSLSVAIGLCGLIWVFDLGLLTTIVVTWTWRGALYGVPYVDTVLDAWTYVDLAHVFGHIPLVVVLFAAWRCLSRELRVATTHPRPAP